MQMQQIYSAFCVSGERATVAVTLVAQLLCSQLQPGPSYGSNNSL